MQFVLRNVKYQWHLIAKGHFGPRLTPAQPIPSALSLFFMSKQYIFQGGDLSPIFKQTKRFENHPMLPCKLNH